jgi:hypothetical protein
LPSRHHFRISAGEDRTLSLTARGAGGAILDLTTYSISWSMAHTKGGAPVLQKTGTVVSAVAGTFTISLTDSDTNLLKAGTYFHQALATAGATTLNVAEGNIQVSLENTGVLQSSLGMSYDGTQFYSTRAQAALARIGLSVPFLWTAGANSPGDGQGQLYKRVGSQPSHTRYFQSADGAYWETASWGYMGDQNGPFSNVLTGSFAWRFGDHLAVGAGTDADFTTTGGNTFVGDNSTDYVMGAQYIERAATFFSPSAYGGIGVAGASRSSDQYAVWGVTTIHAAGLVVTAGERCGYGGRLYTATTSGTTGATPLTHTTGTASDGAVTWRFDGYTYLTPIGGAFLVMHDVDDSRGAHAGYFEAQRTATGGTTFSRETAGPKNRGNDVVTDPYNALAGGSTHGDLYAGGADDAYGGEAANNTSVAQSFIKNAKPYNTIGVVASDAVALDGSSRGYVWKFAAGHMIAWYGAAAQLGARIWSSNTTASSDCGVEFAANTIRFIGSGGTIIGQVENVSGAAAYLRFISNTSVSPELRAGGTGADIDLLLTPKGTGNLKFGTHTGSADAAVNGYITIKDAAGNTRKLATIA